MTEGGKTPAEILARVMEAVEDYGTMTRATASIPIWYQLKSDPRFIIEPKREAVRRAVVEAVVQALEEQAGFVKVHAALAQWRKLAEEGE